MYPAFPAGLRRKTYGVSDSPSEFTFDQVKLGVHLPSEQAVKEVLRAAQAFLSEPERGEIRRTLASD